VLRFGYGAIVPWVTRLDDGTLRAIAGPEMILRTSVHLVGQNIQNMKTFDTHIQRNDIPIVVDFWGEWCGPCKAMAAAFERVTGELEPEFRFLKVDQRRKRRWPAVSTFEAFQP
jgi:thiol-disulfide isomerase/thioredoxin